MKEDSGEPVDGRVRCSLSRHRIDQCPHRLSGRIHNLSLNHRFRSLARWRDSSWPSGHLCRSLGHRCSGNISGRSLDRLLPGWIGLLVGLLVFLLLVKHYFKTGWLGAIGVSIMAIVVGIVLIFILGALALGALFVLPKIPGL